VKPIDALNEKPVILFVAKPNETEFPFILD